MVFITPNSIYGYNKNIQIILNMIESLENKNFIKGIIPLKSLKTALQFDVPKNL